MKFNQPFAINFFANSFLSPRISILAASNHNSAHFGFLCLACSSTDLAFVDKPKPCDKNKTSLKCSSIPAKAANAFTCFFFNSRTQNPQRNRRWAFLNLKNYTSYCSKSYCPVKQWSHFVRSRRQTLDYVHARLDEFGTVIEFVQSPRVNTWRNQSNFYPFLPSEHLK